MQARLGAVLVALALAGAVAGARSGPAPGPIVAQTGGTSSSSGSGSSASGTGGSGSPEGGSPGNGSSGNGSSGTSSGSATSDAPTPDDEGGDGGTGGGRGEDPSGPGTTAPGKPATTVPVGIPQPSTPRAIPAERVRDGRPADCGPEFVVGLRCFDVGGAGGTQGVRVPDGTGGFVVVPIAPVPVVNVDTGASTSASSNVDLRIGVSVRTGEVVRVERRTDARRQRGFATVAILLLAVIAAASVATHLRVRRLGSP